MSTNTLTEEAVRSALRKFRIGGAIICGLPLVGGMVLSMGHSREALPLTVMSASLIMLVSWTVMCVEGLLKRLKAAEIASAEVAAASPAPQA